jgi:hypothetical protein
MISNWTRMATLPRYKSLKGTIEAGLRSLQKYHRLALKLDANIICLGTTSIVLAL